MAHLTPQQRDELLADYRCGMRVEMIAAKYGVAKSYPALLSKRRGRLTRRVRSPLLLAAYRKIVIQRTRGMRTTLIAKYWGVTPRQIQRVYKEFANA